MTSAVQEERRLTADTSRALGERLHDSEAVARVRAQGAEAAGRLSMPTRMERPWKYVDVSRLSLEGYDPAMTTTASMTSAEARMRYALAGGLAALVVQLDGQTAVCEAAADGLTVAPFEDIGQAKTQAALTDHFAQAVPVERNAFTAFHYGFLRGGVLVAAAANAEVKAPVRIVRDYQAGGQLATPHTLIVAGANSRLDVIEDCRSGDGDIVVLPAVEIFPGPAAQVRYTVLHRWGTETRVFSEQRTVTDRDSSVVSLSLVAGGRVVKSHIESSLAGRGSSSELFGLSVGRGREQADFYTLQDHIAPDTRSDLLFKSALKDASRAVYYGLTRVGLGAKNADANQEDRNLLLSREAKADSDPVLEILTHDIIRASHGATAGPVDEEQLFYLEARGLPRAQAEALLVNGFLSQVLGRVPDETLRAELEQTLAARLEAV